MLSVYRQRYTRPASTAGSCSTTVAILLTLAFFLTAALPEETRELSDFSALLGVRTGDLIRPLFPMQITRKQVEEVARAAQQYQRERDNRPQEAAASADDLSHSGEQKADYLKLITELSEEEQKDLLALLWLGRGDYSTFRRARRKSDQKWEQKDAIISQVSESEAIDLYLKEGLKKARPL